MAGAKNEAVFGDIVGMAGMRIRTVVLERFKIDGRWGDMLRDPGARPTQGAYPSPSHRLRGTPLSRCQAAW